MTTARNGWPWLIVTLIVLALGSKGYQWWQTRATPTQAAKQAPTVPVRVTTVQRQDVPHFSTGVGTVQPLHRVTIRPQIDGQLTGLYVTEGEMIREGALLATFDDRAIQATLMQAEAETLRADAQLKSAELDLARFQDLAKRQAVSRQQLEQQETLVDQMRAATRAAEATLAAERVRLSYTRITSPISGRVGLRNVDVGNLLRTTDSGGLFTVTQISPMSVVFALPQQQLSRLKKLAQDNTAASVEVFERDGSEALAKGHLLMVDSSVDSNTGTVRLRAEFDNAQAQLWPGQLVTVRIQTGMSRDSLTVPANAVRMGVENTFVYRLQGRQVDIVPVKRVLDENRISIVQGLNAGDTIVTDGFTRLKAGITVDIVAPDTDGADQTLADDSLIKAHE